MSKLLDIATFYVAYFVLHLPLFAISWLFNRLSLMLLMLSLAPMRPWRVKEGSQHGKR